MELSHKQKQFIALAARISHQSDAEDFRHGAILVTHGCVINCSCNKKNSSAFATKFRKAPGIGTVHAEVGAILNCPREQTEGATIYVVRTTKNGSFKNSRPCEMCQAVLVHCRVKKVVFSTGDVENPFDCLKL